jgi:hypothetical protein
MDGFSRLYKLIEAAWSRYSDTSIFLKIYSDTFMKSIKHAEDISTTYFSATANSQNKLY